MTTDGIPIDGRVDIARVSPMCCAFPAARLTHFLHPDTTFAIHCRLKTDRNMAATADELSGLKFGLSDFTAVDTSGRPQVEEGEELAGDYSHVALALGEQSGASDGHLFISST